MSEFLTSLKSDLLDRRFLPVLALLAVALLAALAYAVLGGGSASSPAPPLPSSASTGVTGKVGAIAISPAPTPNQAVSETTSGAPHTNGTPRNPFTPLPGANKPTSTSSSSTSSSSTSAAKGSSGSAKGTPESTSQTPSPHSSGGSEPTTPQPKAKKRPLYYIHFHVSVAFGPVPPTPEGSPPLPAQLTTYNDLAIDQPLPSKENPQLVYLGVLLATGDEAGFALTGAPILHGDGACRPSPSQCQAILLRAGHSETLEVIEASGQPVTYELKVLSISKSVSGSASTSSAGRSLLGRDGVPTLAQLHYASRHGALIPLGRPAFAAHAARRR